MKTQRTLFWGLVCITLGVLFLARNWNLFPLPDWQYVRTLWPLLLILAGFALLLRGTESSLLSTLATVILAVALPFWLFSYIGRHHRDWTNRDLSMRIDGTDEDEDEDADDMAPDENTDAPDRPDRPSTQLRSGTFVEDMPTPAPAEARFVLEGGAARFRIGETTLRLIDAQTQAINLYTMSIDGAGSSQPTVRLSPTGDGEANLKLFDKDNRGNFGDVTVKLNPAPLWDMQFEFGAGDADFDLSRYAVRALKLETGAASLDLRLGDRATQSDVNISSGMSAVKIRVPRSVGVKLTTDGGLNSTNIDDDFDRVGDDTYLTPNYDASIKKITIRYDGGLSSLTVSRY